MTTALVSSPAAANENYEDRCLHQVWEELTAHGLAVGEPTASTCQCFITNLPGVQCELDLLVTGALIWEYLPLGGTSPSPDQTARLVLALFGGVGPANHTPPLPRYPGVALTDTVSQVLTACGMAVRLADVHYGDGEACTKAMVTNPAEPARGQVQISDDGSLRWECLFAAPGRCTGGLASHSIAQTILTVLANRTIAEREETGNPWQSRRTCLTAGGVSHQIPARTTLTTRSAGLVKQTEPGARVSW